MNNKELFIHDLFKDSPFNDELRWQGTIRVAVTFDTEKRPKLSKRSVAVSKHNIWVMSNKKCCVECKLNLLELELINQGPEGTDEIVLHFKKGRLDKERFLQTRIYLIAQMDPDNNQSYITSIRRSLRYISLGFPKDFLIINLDKSLLKQIEKSQTLKRSLVACGIIHTYLAICDLRQQKPDFEFLSQIETLFACDSRELDLSFWHALYGFDASDKFLTVALTLQYNVYFDSLIIRDVQFSSLSKYLPPILKNNKYIKHLVVSNNTTTWTADLGGSLVLNEPSRLCILDISKNTISDTGVAFLARAIHTFTSNFRALSLSHLGLNPEGVNQILESLNMNENLLTSLQALNMSHNTFDDKSIQLFQQWMVEIGNREGSLSRIAVSNVKVPVGKLASAVKKLPSLSYLNLSANIHVKTSDSEIISLLKYSKSLRILCLKDCELPVEIIKKIIDTYDHNQELSDLRLDLSKNIVGERGAELLASALVKSKSLQVLKLSNMGLGVKGTQLILDALPHGIRELRLKGNISVAPPTDPSSPSLEIPLTPEPLKPLSQSLTNLFERVKTLTLLDIRGTDQHKLGVNLGFLIKSLKTKNSVAYLDIRDHNCGPRVFENLCKLLHINSTLKVIHAEGNNIGLKGYIQARNTLLRSTSLLSFSVLSPIYDPSCPQEVTETVLGDIFTQNGLRSLKSTKKSMVPKLSKFKFILSLDGTHNQETKLVLSTSQSSHNNSISSSRRSKSKKKSLQNSDPISSVAVEESGLESSSIRSRSQSNRIFPSSFKSPKDEVVVVENKSRSRSNSEYEHSKHSATILQKTIETKKSSTEKHLEPILDSTPVKVSPVNDPIIPSDSSQPLSELPSAPDLSLVFSELSTALSSISNVSSPQVYHTPQTEPLLSELMCSHSHVDLPPLPSPPIPQLEPPAIPPPLRERVVKRASNSPVIVRAYPQYQPGTLDRLGKSPVLDLKTNKLVESGETNKENNTQSTKERNPTDDLEAYLQGLASQQFSMIGNRPW